MHIRPKPFLTYLLICFAPLLLLAVFSYWNGITATDAAAGADLQDHLNAFTSGVDNVLHKEENEVMRFSVSRATQQFVEKNNPRSATQAILKTASQYFDSTTSRRTSPNQTNASGTFRETFSWPNQSKPILRA